MPLKILVMGLPGSGKTTLAHHLAPLLKAVWWNADEVRSKLGNPGFSPEARLEQARRMGWLCDIVNRDGYTAIADFVCPTEETRQAFGPAFTIWVDRIQSGRFEDTNRMFVPPTRYNYRVTPNGPEAAVEAVAIRRLIEASFR